jgi:hypothetical protein
MSVLGHDPRHERDREFAELMSQSVGGNSDGGGITEDNFVGITGGWITFISSEYIAEQNLSNSGKGVEKKLSRSLGTKFEIIAFQSPAAIETLQDLLI